MANNEYFTYFPKVVVNDSIMTDITVRVNILRSIKNNVSVYQYYTLSNAERPEDVALSVYGDMSLFWIVLLMNDIINPYYDWLLTDDRLYDYVGDKYGTDKIYSIHHYETTSKSDIGSGKWVDFGTPFSQAVTNYDYEYSLNEEKRRIKILKPQYISQVLAEYRKELNGY